MREINDERQYDVQQNDGIVRREGGREGGERERGRERERELKVRKTRFSLRY
jgi:hypothetical protein